ncbi:MAG: hypothetical protein GXO12_05920 [Epsilonproteobacteria bacterium]|nr:hypothetical protein [Campylobacterota bacterium]
MRKLAILLAVVLSLSYGAREKKGQKYYLKRCSSCHGSGKMWGNVATKEEWKSFFTIDIKDLKEFHQDNPEVLKYIDSKEFKKEKARMYRFLQEFASDSETIPSCNN